MPFNVAHSKPQDHDAGLEPFEEWAEPVINDLLSLVVELRSELTAVRGRLARLERSAGRGLIHPTDLIEGWN